MTGYDGNAGVIPRLCAELFRRIEATQGPEHTFKVEASFLEIYNERVSEEIALFLLRSTQYDRCMTY